MLFRAPSTSLESLLQASVIQDVTDPVKRDPQESTGESSRKAQTSKAQIRARNPDKRRVRSGSNAGKKHHIAMAVKKENASRKVRQRERGWCYVYVGNVSPATDEEMLIKLFSTCGHIIKLEIQCSSGLAMTTGKPTPAYYRGHPVRQYATVVFGKPQHAQKALKLHGSRVGGTELVVVRSASDLPEVKEKVERRLRDYRERLGLGHRQGEVRKSAKPLCLQPTEILPVDEPKIVAASPRKLGDRHKIWDFSFPMTVV
ncbi:hypothetical protein SERLA73DRAFT_132684 [Serpula lacrymans var. lacrymans S7.3]|uniref:RRM domain-containing protein n=2 Tax=Serpula lacrymans var. lacrymans TaxID=341189 RepID=F8PP91_SERL3|nr:uncharacterized protein SERLADRAFT_382783 [Serpula lacrymans var. lacrymans S7.9]EGO01968.1 hypothetical protein SERLA73DRAFT_132684 [Serpula lacrymans var. lacrymans S7.3]EGO27595.1 hypothetical protein SERLADRAFT_382783 [Serpula lacrymans var. lacrymans S7.9]